MKALVIDCAISRLSITAKNDDKICCATYDIGMKQSEILINSIDYVLKSVDLQTDALDYTALTVGPGSFTGLRLGISALKAIQLAYNVPIYGISSLDIYGFPFNNFEIPVLCEIDAHKDKFYTKVLKNGKTVVEEDDYEIDQIVSFAKKFDKLIIAGPESDSLKEIIKEKLSNTELITLSYQPIVTESLFALAENKIAAKEAPLKDFDGPVYLRASEAEIKLNN